MKRTVAFILSLCTVFTLCACGRTYTAQEAEEAIEAIGEVSLEDKKAIRTAERIYESLGEEEQKKVAHADDLAAARETYDMLLAEYKRVRPEGKEAAIKAVKRLSLVGEWVCVRTDGFVFLNLSEDGTAEAKDAYGTEDVFFWTLSDELDSITLDNGKPCTFQLGEFAGFTAILEYEIFYSREEYLIKKDAFGTLAEKYYTFVELTPENVKEYIGEPKKLAEAYDGLSICAISSNARANGLILVGVRDNVAFKYSGKYGMYFKPVGDNGPFGGYMELWSNVRYDKKITQAEGVLIFVSEDKVESVTYSEDGTRRIIKMKDGFEIIEGNQLSDAEYGPFMQYLAEAGVQY